MELTVTATGKTPAEIGKEIIAIGKALSGVEVGKVEKPGKGKTGKQANGASDEDEDFDLDDKDADEDGDLDTDDDGDDDGDDDEQEAAGPTEDDVRAALNKLAKKKGKKAAISILKKFKAEGVDDLKEKNYAAVIKLAKV